jgi:HK97 family phage prohead protease
MLYGVDPSSEASCDATKGWLDAMIDRDETAEEAAGGEQGAPMAEPLEAGADSEMQPEAPVGRATYNVPEYIRAAARKGLEWYAQGLAGDGLQPETVADARKIATGKIDSEKLVRMAAWIRRHRIDWENVVANRDASNPDFPGHGAVAAYLWGVQTTDASATDRVLKWADGLIAGEMPARAATNEHEIRVQPIGDFIVSDTADGQKTFTGYAAVFNTASEGLPFVERIAPGAFKRAITQADQGRRVIKFLHGHDESRMLATTASGRLKLQEDQIGLRVEAKLDPADPDAAAVISKLTHEASAMGMSFGFTVPKNGQQWNEDGSRTLTDVGLLEVSTLSGHTPAYPATLGLTAVRKAAKPLGVDAEALVATVEAIKAGKKLDEDQTNLLDKVRARLGAKPKAVHPSVAAKKLAIALMMQEDV